MGLGVIPQQSRQTAGSSLQSGADAMLPGLTPYVFDGTVSRFCLTSHVALLSGEDEPTNTQLKNAIEMFRGR